MLAEMYGWDNDTVASMPPVVQVMYLDRSRDGSTLTFPSEKEYMEWLRQR